MAKPPLEKEIQLTVCDYLERKRYMFWRQNTAPVWDKDHFRSMPKYSMKGVPDIILIKDGQFIGLEIKRPKGIQSDIQKIFQHKCEKAGGRYHLITSLEEVIKLGL